MAVWVQRGKVITHMIGDFPVSGPTPIAKWSNTLPLTARNSADHTQGSRGDNSSCLGAERESNYTHDWGFQSIRGLTR